MSKTYRKNIRIGICYGSNTEFYRSRRRRKRRSDNTQIRTVVGKYDGEDIDDALNIERMPKRNSWLEPTDGTVTYRSSDINHIARESSESDFKKRILRILKKKG